MLPGVIDVSLIVTPTVASPLSNASWNISEPSVVKSDDTVTYSVSGEPTIKSPVNAAPLISELVTPVIV